MKNILLAATQAASKNPSQNVVIGITVLLIAFWYFARFERNTNKNTSHHGRRAEK